MHRLIPTTLRATGRRLAPSTTSSSSSTNTYRLLSTTHLPLSSKTEDEEMLRDTVAAFAQAEIAPLVSEMDLFLSTLSQLSLNSLNSLNSLSTLSQLSLNSLSLTQLTRLTQLTQLSFSQLSFSQLSFSQLSTLNRSVKWMKIHICPMN